LFNFDTVPGLQNEPKWGHLRDLHKAIKQSEPALVSTDPKVTSLGYNLEVKSLSWFVVKTNINYLCVENSFDSFC